MFLDFLVQLLLHPVPYSPTLLENCITQEWIKDAQVFEVIKYDMSPHLPPGNRKQQNINEFQPFHS